MKILKKGVIPGDRLYVGKCHHCSTEVEAKQSELRFTDSLKGPYGSADCPLCQKEMHFDPKRELETSINFS